MLLVVIEKYRLKKYKLLAKTPYKQLKIKLCLKDRCIH